MTKRPSRVVGFAYNGFNRYLLTICTAFRREVFISGAVMNDARQWLTTTATLFDFSTAAYCFMPDHVHAVMVGTSELSPFEKFVHRFKQMTGFHFRQMHHESLWQPGYHERVLRDDEATEAVMRYVLENPIRAGLAKEFGEYPYCGSDIYGEKELVELWRSRQA